MAALLGIDLGTSSVKAVVVGLEGQVLGVGNAEYPILTPQPGFAEQDPQDWWQATVGAVREAMTTAAAPEISGIGFSGQMHGLVLVDDAGQPVRNAIIWADQRSASILSQLKEVVGEATFGEECGTAPAAGFFVATLYWLMQYEGDSLRRARRAILPKDYVRARCTDRWHTDYGDAAATGMFAVRTRVWSETVLKRLEVDPRLLPEAVASSTVVGELTRTAAEALGLHPGIPVVVGTADQPAQALGNGIVDPPRGSVTIGTGGQVFAPLTEPVSDPRLHTFCHAIANRWYMLGAMLAAGMALRWFKNHLADRSYADLDAAAELVPPGSEGLVFLPYLVGERSPLMDPGAQGTFAGLRLRHGIGHLARSILEGVAFALRQIIEVMEERGAHLDRIVASGNGMSSPLWRQVVADVLERPLLRGRDEHAGERAGIGAALLAGLGTGIFSNTKEISRFTPQFDQLTRPNPKTTEQYRSSYERFRDLYPRLRDWF
jgi:xylulokinase